MQRQWASQPLIYSEIWLEQCRCPLCCCAASAVRLWCMALYYCCWKKRRTACERGFASGWFKACPQFACGGILLSPALFIHPFDLPVDSIPKLRYNIRYVSSWSFKQSHCRKFIKKEREHRYEIRYGRTSQCREKYIIQRIDQCRGRICKLSILHHRKKCWYRFSTG